MRRFCEKLGYRVRELADGAPTEIGPGFTVTCGQVPFYDSWLLMELDGRRILNTNDCILESPDRLESITKRVGRCDVLFTQFSYANWVSERADDAARRALAEEKLRRVRIQCEAFGPKFVVPFASFVYFCHEENGYMNNAINTVNRCAEFILAETGATPIVLRPNETWDGVSHKRNTESLEYWQARYGELMNGQLPVVAAGDSVPVADLRAAAAAMQRRVAEHNHYFVLKLATRLGLLARTVFQVTDLDVVLAFDWIAGLVVLDGVPAGHETTISLHSESLLFVLENDYGVDTLNVNARFEGTVAAKKAMIRNFGVLSLNNTGRYLNLGSTSAILRPEFLKQGLRTTGLVRQPTG